MQSRRQTHMNTIEIIKFTAIYIYRPISTSHFTSVLRNVVFARKSITLLRVQPFRWRETTFTARWRAIAGTNFPMDFHPKIAKNMLVHRWRIRMNTNVSPIADKSGENIIILQRLCWSSVSNVIYVNVCSVDQREYLHRLARTNSGNE